jgi:glycerol-3-phosphate acyltransferase PlsY
MAAAVSAPVGAALFGRFDLVMLLLALAAIVLWKHAENIERLLAGTEPRIGRGNATEAQDADTGVLQDG